VRNAFDEPGFGFFGVKMFDRSVRYNLIYDIRLKSVAEMEEQSILVVDDSPEDRELFRVRLERGGYSVVEANSGREALAAIEKTRFPLLILDLSMYDMDGFEVLRAIRSKHPELKIIVASGFLDGKMLQAARSLGADATLDKKMTAELLLPMVGNLLENPK
jgi:CheY-like chemotaxis protein